MEAWQSEKQRHLFAQGLAMVVMRMRIIDGKAGAFDRCVQVI